MERIVHSFLFTNISDNLVLWINWLFLHIPYMKLHVRSIMNDKLSRMWLGYWQCVRFLAHEGSSPVGFIFYQYQSQCICDDSNNQYKENWKRFSNLWQTFEFQLYLQFNKVKLKVSYSPILIKSKKIKKGFKKYAKVCKSVYV